MKVNEYRVVKTENYGIPKLSLAHTYETAYNGEGDYKALVDMLDEIFLLSHLNEEYLYIIAMDTNYHIKGIYEAGHGNYNSVPVYSRELYTFLLLAGAESFVAIHNHPDGNTKISDNDINWTSVMKICGNILNISFLKHIIVTEEEILFVDDDGEEKFMTDINENHN